MAIKKKKKLSTTWGANEIDLKKFYPGCVPPVLNYGNVTWQRQL